MTIRGVNQQRYDSPQPLNGIWAWTPTLNMPVFTPSIVSSWSIPPAISWYQSWSTNLLQTTLSAPPIKPFFQSDWANPVPTSGIDQTISRSGTYLLGKDTLPIRQQDWKNPYPVQWYQDYRVNLLQNTLFTVPQKPPMRQRDWPNPSPYLQRNISESYSSPLPLTTFVPPVSTGTFFRHFIADMGRMMST